MRLSQLFLIGVSECDKKRNKTTDPEVIVLPPDVGDGGKGADNDTTVPVPPTWPTDSGITKEGATRMCRLKLEASTTYKVCAKVLGLEFTVKVAGIYKQCVADIQVG